MSKTILLIDGENFLHKIEDVIMQGSKAKGLSQAVDIDLDKLFANALKGLNISQKIFYGAKLHFNPDTPQKSEELIRTQRKLINNLKKQGYQFVMAGNVRAQKVGNKVIFKEKGVDVKIAVDMVSMSCDKKVDTIILCSSDSDLQPAISEVKKRKVEILYLGFELNPNKGLTFTTDRTILLRNSEILDSFKRVTKK